MTNSVVYTTEFHENIKFAVCTSMTVTLSWPAPDVVAKQERLTTSCPWPAWQDPIPGVLSARTVPSTPFRLPWPQE
jgi:hypothetical protein